MRALVVLLLSTQAAFASINTVTSRIEVQNTQQPLGISGISSSPTTQNIRATVGVSTDRLGHGFTFQTKMIEDNPDYSGLQLHNNQNQTVTPPANAKEFQSEASLDWQKNSYHAFASVFGHLSRSPFATRGATLALEKTFFEKTTIVGLETSSFQQDRPSDYFIDRDFIFKQRPLQVHAVEWAVHAEQVLSARWKVRGRLSTSQRTEERPRQYGIELKAAHAFTGRLFGNLSVGYFQENQNELLKNERGFFTAGLSQVEITYEPLYDLWISASYGFTVEQENDPRVATTTQVGTDQFGLGIRYAWGDLIFSLQGSQMVSNALTANYKLAGGIAWTL